MPTSHNLADGEGTEPRFQDIALALRAGSRKGIPATFFDKQKSLTKNKDLLRKSRLGNSNCGSLKVRASAYYFIPNTLALFATSFAYSNSRSLSA